jgi:2-keto-3-deoxygluconate permease
VTNMNHLHVITAASGATARRIGRVPGAAVLFPLAIGLTAANLAPSITRLGPMAGGLTGGGTVTLVGLLLVCVGSQISPASVRGIGSRVAVVLAAATILTGAIAIGYVRVVGPAGLGGVPAVAVVVAATCTSPAVWLTLAVRYGSPDDRWAGVVAATLNSCPAVPMLVLLAAGHGSESIPVRGLLDSAAPLAAGIVLGRIRGVAATTRGAITPMMVAVSFGLGCQLHLASLGKVWLAGAALGAGAALAKGGLVAGCWRLLLRQPSAVGWSAAACTVAAPLVPHILAAESPIWAPQSTAASADLAVAVLMSTLLAPLLTAVAGRHRARRRHNSGEDAYERQEATGRQAEARTRPVIPRP